MTIYTTTELILIDTISGVIKNLPWFILIYWGIKTIMKDMPKWISQYDELKLKHYKIDRALAMRETLK